MLKRRHPPWVVCLLLSFVLLFPALLGISTMMLSDGFGTSVTAMHASVDGSITSDATTYAILVLVLIAVLMIGFAIVDFVRLRRRHTRRRGTFPYYGRASPVSGDSGRLGDGFSSSTDFFDGLYPEEHRHERALHASPRQFRSGTPRNTGTYAASRASPNLLGLGAPV